MNKTKKAFTLIELMIAVGVLAVLSGITLSVINSSELQRKARDSQRISDMKKIQTALELYYADHRQYPTPLNESDTGWVILTLPAGIPVGTKLVEGAYISVMPTDPLHSSDQTRRYCYKTNGGSDYQLCTHLESADTSKCQFTDDCADDTKPNCCRFISP